MYSECPTCGGGGVKQYFNHPDKKGYEVRCKPRTNTFSILLNNHVIGGPFWGYLLKQKVNELVK